MKKSSIIWIIVGVLILSMFGKACSVANKCVDYETDIEKQNEQMANVRGVVTQKITGVGLAADQYTDKVIEAFEKANESRYGEEGSKAAFQVFVEQNPQISPEVYMKVQQVIEAVWTDFQNVQTGAVDRAFNYKNYLRRVPNGFIARILGYPKIDMKKYEKAVTTKDARKAIETREDDGVNPFEKKK